MNQVNLSDIITLQKGKKPKEIKSACCDSFFPYVDIKAFETGKIDKFTDGEKCVKCEDNDLLIVCDGSRSGLIGKAVKGFVGSTLARIDCDLSVDKDYLYYFIQSKYKLLNSNVKGTGTPHLKQELLKSFRLYLPSIERQKQIVKQIEESLSQLDNAVETLNKTKQQLEIYRQAVLKEAFSGKLTHQKKDGYNQDWSTVSITKLIRKEKNSLKAGPFGSALKKSCYVPSGYKVYGQEQVIACDETIGNYYVNDKKYKELFNCRVRPHDILISLVGTVGKVLILSNSCKKGIINPRLIKVSLDESVYLPEFFKYYFESAYLKSLYKLKTHGATMDVLNMGMIKELPFPLCSTDEQADVIQAIEMRFSTIDKNERTINQSLQQAEALRQSILKQAFEEKYI